MITDRLTFKTPVNFTEQNVKYFLSNVEGIFKLNNKGVPNVFFDTHCTQKISMLGQLLIYKFLEYTVTKKCFLNPECTIVNDKVLNNEFEKYSFKKMIYAFINDSVPQTYDLKYRQSDGIFIAPMSLSRNYSKEEIDDNYVSKVNNFYDYDNIIAFTVLTCIGEISSNFQEHAVEDTKSILVATGNKKYFEVACADTGNGILSTLTDINNRDFNYKTKYDLLRCSLNKGVSSKKEAGHMGYGLWLVNEFVSACKGELLLFSEGAYYSNKVGKIKYGDSPYWKGTIIYAKLFLDNSGDFRHVINQMKPIMKNKLQKI